MRRHGTISAMQTLGNSNCVPETGIITQESAVCSCATTAAIRLFAVYQFIDRCQKFVLLEWLAQEFVHAKFVRVLLMLASRA